MEIAAAVTDAFSGLLDWAVEHPVPALVAVAVVALAVFANTFHTTTQWRDPQRIYNSEQRAIVKRRAGNRCESRSMFGLLRCRAKGEQIDHVYPWSKGGPTTLENAALLCGPCNRKKSAHTPSRMYVWHLERARRKYFPAGEDVRVRVAVR